MSFWCLQFYPKNERKQVDLRYHSCKVEFVRSFFGRQVSLKKQFRLCLTFNFSQHFEDHSEVLNKRAGRISTKDYVLLSEHACLHIRDFRATKYTDSVITLFMNDTVGKRVLNTFVLGFPKLGVVHPPHPLPPVLLHITE